MSYSGVNLTALMVMVILSRSIGSSLKSQPKNEQVATTSQENRSRKRIETESYQFLKVELRMPSAMGRELTTTCLSWYVPLPGIRR